MGDGPKTSFTCFQGPGGVPLVQGRPGLQNGNVFRQKGIITDPFGNLFDVGGIKEVVFSCLTGTMHGALGPLHVV